MNKSKQKLYKIGELAKMSAIKTEALRFYETEGLLIPARRNESGYRLYNEQNVQSLFFILHAKKIGFTLKEIKFLLDFQNNKSSHTCEEVKQYTGGKIREIEAKIADLKTMHSSLSQLHQACCGGMESAKNCSILKNLAS